MERIDRRRVGVLLAVAVPSLAVATLLVWFLQDVVGVPNPSSIYLVAVVATAIVAGWVGALVASVASFLVYNFLFVDPRYTLTVAQPGELINLVLLLFVGLVVGQLAALQRSQTETAREREREAYAMFRLSRALATRASTPAVLPDVVGILAEQTGMDRTWIALGSDDTSERIAADTAPAEPPGVVPGQVRILRRMPGDTPAKWIRVHQPTPRARTGSGREAYRVRIEAGGASLGSIWCLRPRGAGEPGRTETRLLAAAADQVGQALTQDRLVAEAQAAEIARQSDALKSALLQSVSHDLRTPLATIRAAAGTLRPGSGLSPDELLESAEAIDREVEYLDRIVTNLLDLSRIEAGALRAEADVYELDDLVGSSLARVRPRLDRRTIVLGLDAPPVTVDPVFLDEIVTNILENARKYTQADATIHIGAASVDDGRVRLTIEDDGPGVPNESLGRLFEKFYRVPDRAGGSRAGTGIGLAVVRGLAEAMGGEVVARRSALGGLAIDLDLPAASTPAHAAATVAG